jgi:hypothetical protein
MMMRCIGVSMKESSPFDATVSTSSLSCLTVLIPSICLHSSRRCSTPTKFTGVNSFHNAITRPCRQCTNAQRLDGSIRRTSLRADRDPVLDVAEAEKDDDGDGDRDEKGVVDVVKGEIWYHWD